MPTVYPSEGYFINDGDIPDFRFEYVDVKKEMVDALKYVLPKFGGSDIKVLKADPLTPTEIPCIAVNRVNADESNQTIADVLQAPEYDSATMQYTVVKGTMFLETVEVRVWHTNADERDRLYPLINATCIALRDKLVFKGLRNIVLRGGKDEQDLSTQEAPTPLYFASIMMSYLNPLNIYIETIEQPITQDDLIPNQDISLP